MQVAVLLSPGVTAFEALGPYGVFRRVPGARVRLVADAPAGTYFARLRAVNACGTGAPSAERVIVVP